MPYMCCVPHCKGNYKSGPKVHVFGFPKNEIEKNKWLRAIRRKDFVPNNYSKVCQLHFKPSDIRRTTSAFDEQKGITLTCALKVPQLVSGAVPTIFPNCTCLTSSGASREKTNKTREQSHLTSVLVQSKREYSALLENDQCLNFETLTRKIHFPMTISSASAVYNILDAVEQLHVELKTNSGNIKQPSTIKLAKSLLNPYIDDDNNRFLTQYG